MAPPVIVTFVLVALGLHLTAVTGLRCHCDFCPGKNNTCETDGFCLSVTWLQRETGIVHHAYRCLDKKMFFPQPHPGQCWLTSKRHVEVTTACCDRDLCNRQLTPSLEGPQSTREPHLAAWLDKGPRNGTPLVNNNATSRRRRPDGATAPTGTASNFKNSTEQLDE